MRPNKQTQCQGLPKSATKRLKYLSLCLATLALCAWRLAYAQVDIPEIRVAVYIDGAKHRREAESLFHLYDKQNPQVKVILKVHRGIDRYTEKVIAWLNGENAPDLIYWYGGARIAQFAKQGKLHSLQNFWDEAELDKVLSSASRDAVEFNNEAYALPATSMVWALFYDKKRIQSWGMKEPETWDEVLAACKTLRAKGIDLFAFGSKTDWATHAWFDYLDMRTNGLEYHKALLAGEIPYTDQGVINTLERWKELLDYQCFNQNHARLTIWEAFPRIVLGKSAYSLTEVVPDFIRLPDTVEISVMHFPLIDPKQPYFTVSPFNVFIVPVSTKLDKNIKDLLRYIVSVPFQERFSKNLIRIPANVHASTKLPPLNQKVANLLNFSPGGIQFLDRDTDIRFGSRTPKIFTSFMQHKSVKRVSFELELLREEVFGPLPAKVRPELH